MASKGGNWQLTASACSVSANQADQLNVGSGHGQKHFTSVNNFIIRLMTAYYSILVKLEFNEFIKTHYKASDTKLLKLILSHIQT